MTERLIDAGISDWGGVSPLTRDWVNPEKPWPGLGELAEATAAAGKALVPRLTVYPAFATRPDAWLDSSGGALGMAGLVASAMDAGGWARGGGWVAGASGKSPAASAPAFLKRGSSPAADDAAPRGEL